MRTLFLIALVVVFIVGAATPGHAESCTGITGNGGRFATCFDLGNRLSVTAGSDGLGGALALRHVVTFDDEPDLAWKLEHQVLEATHAAFEDRFTGVLYRGRFLRHSRDGHLVIPLGTPKKVFLPFDIGGFAEAGRLEWVPGSTAIKLGVVKTAALFDLARTRSFRRRLTIGPSARWDVDADRDAMTLTQHSVSAFTTVLGNAHVEAANGRTAATVEIEAGTAWHSKGQGWRPELRAEASLERIVVAVNDHPISLVFGARYDSQTDEVLAKVGARVVLFDRRDPRVQLDPLVKR